MMYIYIFRSKLFQGLDQKRVVILDFPISNSQFLEDLVNKDNMYSRENSWQLTEVK